jgi:plastocyanin
MGFGHLGVRFVAVWVCVVLTSAGCSPASEPNRAPAPDARQQAPARTRVVGRAPAGAFVRLEPLFAHDFPSTPSERFVDQSAQTFVPGALVARTGEAVEFRSSEDILHNVRVIRAEDKAPIFNVATPPWGSYTHTFTDAGTYEVTCDIHMAMRATILVMPTPYATIADESGAFSFDAVVPGSYKLIGFSGEHAVERVVAISGSSMEVAVP